MLLVAAWNKAGAERFAGALKGKVDVVILEQE
jgi:hypothetical protein